MKNLSRIDLNLLVAFDALMAERNVTRAGERIGLSQPALSKALNRLRHMFGDALFVRRTGTMEPTARAKELAGPVRRALDEIARAFGPAGAAFDPAAVRATLTMASTDLTDCVLLPRLMARVRSLAPGLDLRVVLTDRLRGPGQLASGEADLLIGPAGEIVIDLNREPLYSEEQVTLLARDHPALAGGRRLTLKSFLAAGHVMVSTEGRGTGPIDAMLASRGLKRRIAVVLPAFAAVPLIVGATDLIATLPSRLVASLAPAARIGVARPPIMIEGFTVHLMWHGRRDADPLHAWLRGVIRDVASTLEPVPRLR